jgi:hypothetical protein
MPSVGFEPTFPTLDLAATVIGKRQVTDYNYASSMVRDLHYLASE